MTSPRKQHILKRDTRFVSRKRIKTYLVLRRLGVFFHVQQTPGKSGNQLGAETGTKRLNFSQ